MDRARATFQQLRPSCVVLSQAVLKLRSSPSGDKKTQDELVAALTTVHQQLVTIASKDPRAVDERIADYVYFPIDHVLDQFDKVSTRGIELSCSTIIALLQTAWQKSITPVFAIRLLDRLSPLIDKDNGDRITEELVSQCLTSINLTFVSLGGSPMVSNIGSPNNIPHVGQAIFQILQQAESGSSIEIQQSALTAVKNFVQMYPDRNTLGTKFFPGIVSTLSKVLSPKATGRRAISVTVLSIQLLGLVLVRIFGEARELVVHPSSETENELSAEWTNIARSQIKVVVGNVVKFRTHERQEVRKALADFCVDLIENCSSTLGDLLRILIETSLASVDVENSQQVISRLKGSLILDEKLSGLLEEIVHDWILAFPRLSQTSDPIARSRSLGAIKLAISLLSETDSDPTILQQSLATNLQESVLLSIPKALQKFAISEGVFGHAALDVIPSQGRGSTAFTPIFRDSSNDQDALTSLRVFMQDFPSSEMLESSLDSVLTTVEFGTGHQRVASFWLSLNILRTTLESDTAQFLNFEREGSPMESLEHLYAISLDILEAYDADNTPWQLKALALECIAEQSRQAGEDFSLDLVDSLFPVLQLIGSPIKGLRDHAATCLNVIAEVCNYSDVRELIVSNADYLVNAVGLKLNAFDTSPGAPMVLLMMVRLCGPSILPFIDDVVDTIFAALESYHGFPEVVETLFAVIKVIADEGVRAPQLQITEGGETRDVRPRGDCTFQEVLQSITKAAKLVSDEAVTNTNEEGRPNPTVKADKAPEDELDLPTPDDGPTKSLSESKTYRLLFNISELTQHYLPYQSPSFRRSILSLLTVTLPAISKHENSFLPLINTLWPVVAVRIGDREPFVAAAALDVVRTMCEHARSFMRSRIQDQWPQIVGVLKSTMHRRAGESAGLESGRPLGAPHQSKPGPIRPGKGGSHVVRSSTAYVDPSIKSLQESASNLILSVVEHVRISDELFDEALSLFSHRLADPDVRGTFESRNADAVWLAMLQMSQELEGSAVYEEFKPELERIRQPPSGGRWDFVTIM